jgi:hypothetical protein|tara:strand:- start:191 stop:361 length:171 start_codon:yes stop_codon:yes gene_type:complete
MTPRRTRVVSAEDLKMEGVGTSKIYSRAFSKSSLATKIKVTVLQSIAPGGVVVVVG